MSIRYETLAKTLSFVDSFFPLLAGSLSSTFPPFVGFCFFFFLFTGSMVFAPWGDTQLPTTPASTASFLQEETVLQVPTEEHEDGLGKNRVDTITSTPSSKPTEPSAQYMQRHSTRQRKQASLPSHVATSLASRGKSEWVYYCSVCKKRKKGKESVCCDQIKG